MTVTVRHGEEVVVRAATRTLTAAVDLLARQSDACTVELSFKNTNPPLARSTNVEFEPCTPDDAAARLSLLECRAVTVTASATGGALMRWLRSLRESDAVVAVEDVVAVDDLVATDDLVVEIVRVTGTTVVESRYNARDIDALLEPLSDVDVTLALVELPPRAAVLACRGLDCGRVTVTAHGIDVSKSLPGLAEGSASLAFCGLGRDAAVMLIPNLRETNTDFVLCFDNLTEEQVHCVVAHADVEQEDVVVSSVKSLEEVFGHRDGFGPELVAMSNRGMQHMVAVNERDFIPWRSVFFVCLIGAVQVGAGAALVMTGFGAQSGMALITEGIADFATAGRVAYTRQFSWRDYVKQKASSLVISAATLGWSAIKDAGKGVNTFASGVVQEAAEQGVTQLVANGNAVVQTVKSSTKELGWLATKCVATGVAETVGREALNAAADCMMKHCFSRWKPQIVGCVRQEVDSKFVGSRLRALLTKWYVIDRLRRNSALESRVADAINETLNPSRSFWQQQWDSVGTPLVKGILSTPQLVGNQLSMMVRITSILRGMHSLVTVIETFHAQLTAMRLQLDADCFPMRALLVEHANVSDDEAQGIVNRLRAAGVVENEFIAVVAPSAIAAVDFGPYAARGAAVLAFLQRMIDASRDVDVQSTKDRICDLMADHIIAIADNQLSAPITSAVAGAIVGSLSATVQDKLIRNELEVRQTALSEEWMTLTGGATSAPTLPDGSNRLVAIQAEHVQLRSLLDSNGRITYGDMVMYVAEKKVVAHTQLTAKCAAGSRAVVVGGQAQCAHQHSAAVQRLADAVRAGASADLLIVERMLADNGIPAVVSDNPDYCLTDADVTAGKVLLVCKPPTSESRSDSAVAAGASSTPSTAAIGIGHWVQKLADGKEISPPSEGVDCGFALVGRLTGKSVDTLRKETADSILKHSAAFEVAIQEQEWLSDRHPELANRLWLRGGRVASELKGNSGGSSSGEGAAANNIAETSQSGVRPTRTEGRREAAGDAAARGQVPVELLSDAVETGLEALIIAREKLVAAGLASGDEEAAGQLAFLAGVPVQIALKAFRTARQYKAQKAEAGSGSMLEAATRVVGSDVVSGLTDRVVSALAGTEVAFVPLLQASGWMSSQGDRLRSQFESYTAEHGFNSHADGLADAAAFATVLGLPADGFSLLRTTGEKLQQAAAHAHEDGFTYHADGLSEAAAIFTLVGSLPKLGEIARDAIFGSTEARSRVGPLASAAAPEIANAVARSAASRTSALGWGSSSAATSWDPVAGRDQGPVVAVTTAAGRDTTTWQDYARSMSSFLPSIDFTLSFGGGREASPAVSRPSWSITGNVNVNAGDLLLFASSMLTRTVVTAAALGYSAYKVLRNYMRERRRKRDGKN